VGSGYHHNLLVNGFAHDAAKPQRVKGDALLKHTVTYLHLAN